MFGSCLAPCLCLHRLCKYGMHCNMVAAPHTISGQHLLTVAGLCLPSALHAGCKPHTYSFFHTTVCRPEAGDACDCHSIKPAGCTCQQDGAELTQIRSVVDTRRARLTAARRPLRPAVSPAQWLAAAPLLALHALVVWRICFVSYGWPALLISPGLAWTVPLLAWLLVARRRAILAARRRGASSVGPASPRAWPAALLPDLPPGAAKNR